MNITRIDDSTPFAPGLFVVSSLVFSSLFLVALGFSATFKMSVCSTPKRAKTAWTVLLKNVDNSLVPPGVDLKSLLSEAEEADTFVQLAEKSQRAILTDILGDGMSDLVNSIIWSIKQKSSGSSLLDRILSYDLGPSEIEEGETLVVAGYIMNFKPGVYPHPEDQLTTLVFGEKYQPPDSPPNLTECDETLKILRDSVNKHKQKTYRLTLEEAAGYPMLGGHAVHFSEVLAEKLSQDIVAWNQMMVAKNSKPGQNPTSDAAVIMLLQNSDNPLVPIKIQVVVYEYKPKVSQKPSKVEISHLVEALLQAFYILRFYNIRKIIHCLTDLTTWHYFKVEESATSSDKMDIKWWHVINYTFPLDIESVTDHAGFLVTEVEKLFHHDNG